MGKLLRPGQALPPPLPREFYARSVLVVARQVIGQWLVHDHPDGLTVGRIVEAEAYRGPEDKAAHSYGGRRTTRTEAMFGAAGHAYVFLVYGLHVQFNLVCGDVGEPHAVLLRAAEPLHGHALMAARRGVSADRKELLNGPGKLCEAFAITAADYGRDLCEGRLFLAAGQPVAVGQTKRVGIDYAGRWSEKPWRYYARGNPYVSHPPRA